MSDKPVGIGIIGLGNMGKNHIRNYARIDTCKVIGICDVQDDVLEQFSKEYDCKGFKDLTKFLNTPGLDAVSITSPTRTHYTIAKQAILSGKHVLIEKPICDNVDHAQELIELAEKHNRKLLVGHIERFNPAVLKLKEILASGTIGKPTSLIAKRVGAFPAQIKDANVIIDLAVHDIDIFSYLLDQTPTEITGNAGRALNSNREDYAQIFLKYGDQSGIIQVNWITPIRIRNLSITGTKGYVELNYMTQSLMLYESNYSSDFDSFGDFIIKFGEPNKQEVILEKQEPLKLELSHFIECIQQDKTPLITGLQGKKALEIALEVIKKIY
ncbi:Gfo/Idh/MocA family oxidoreductase [bacterium]|jgi:UDP-N-acetylglucosamine 3-dehydrogenase|nr:Gfo/Idh/MocA family oxidoreductase [bacterium]